MNKKYTKEQLIEYIQEFAINNNRLPICRKNELPVNDATIKKYFGSWNNGMIAAGFVPRYAGFRSTKVEVKCKQCNSIFKRTPSQIIKSQNHFCSQPCAATYCNTHKTTGTSRSKLEIWIEKQLTILYPSLKIIYNSKELINSELDIYIPSLKVAFELNGIYHYEPIHGKDKLNQIQNNDNRKFQACLEHGIELCLIDTSSQKYFKPKSSQKYLDIITQILNGKLIKQPWQQDSNLHVSN